MIGQMSADQLKSILYGLDRSDDEAVRDTGQKAPTSAIAAVRAVPVIESDSGRPDGGMTRCRFVSLTDADREATADVRQSTGVS